MKKTSLSVLSWLVAASLAHAGVLCEPGVSDAGAACSLAPTQAPAMETYCNARFEYCVDYPRVLIPRPEADNGDGQRFELQDSQADIRIYGSYAPAVQDLSVAAYFKQRKKENARYKPSYEVLKTGRYVVSYVRDGKIVYEHDLALKNQQGAYVALRFEYPVAEQERMTPIIERMSRRLREAE